MVLTGVNMGIQAIPQAGNLVMAACMYASDMLSKDVIDKRHLALGKA
jgi:hypothetical protein